MVGTNIQAIGAIIEELCITNLLTINIIVSWFFLATDAWEKMLCTTGERSLLLCLSRSNVTHFSKFPENERTVLVNHVWIGRFSCDCRKKLIPKILLQPITTRANSAVNQLEFLAVFNNLLKAREKNGRTRCDWFSFSLVENLAGDF